MLTIAAVPDTICMLFTGAIVAADAISDPTRLV
jgi:hypothetical protein